MPKDSSGKFHLNSQRALAADKSAASKTMPKADSMIDAASDDKHVGSASASVHNNGDGSYRSEVNGESADHPSIHQALAHVGSKLAGGKHVHVHSDGSGMHSAHADESGNNEDHDHANVDDLKSSLDAFLADESHEPAAKDSEENPEGGSHATYKHLSGL